MDAGTLAAMAKAAAEFGVTDGDERLADLVELAVAEAGSARRASS